MEDFKKVVNPVSIDEEQVLCTIKWMKGCLTISGTGKGTWGQIQDTIRHSSKILSRGWTIEQLDTFLDIWDAYHLNILSPMCEHQRALGWGIKASEPLLGETRGWIRQKQDSKGMLCKPCPICGYRYGMEWRTKEVPEWAVLYLLELP